MHKDCSGRSEEMMCCKTELESPIGLPCATVAETIVPCPVGFHAGSGPSSRPRTIPYSPCHLYEKMDDEWEGSEEEESDSSAKEQKSISSRKGRCVRCGIKTHIVSVFAQRPMTTMDVYKGTCIRCNRVLVPWMVRNQWELQNAALLVEDEVGSTCSQVRGYSGVEQGLKTKTLSARTIETECTDHSSTEFRLGQERAEKLEGTKGCAMVSTSKPKRKHSNRCSGCDVRTHKNILGKRFPVTTATVFEGHCLKCAPYDVPLGVLQKYQHKTLVKFVPDRIDMALDMETPSIPSAGGKPHNHQLTRAELDQLLLEEITAGNNELDWSTMNGQCTKPSTLPIEHLMYC